MREKKIVKGICLTVLLCLMVLKSLLLFGIRVSAEDGFVIEDGVLISYHGAGGDIQIPEGVVTIGEKAFYEQTGITGVSMPDSVQYIEANAFSGCTELKNITLSNNLREIGEEAFWHCTSLEGITFPESLKEIGETAFFNCLSIRSITFPAGLEKIGNFAFLRTSCMEFRFLSGDVDFTIDALASYDPQIRNETNKNVYRTDVTIYAEKGSKPEQIAKRLGYIFKATDTGETIEYGQIKSCYEVTRALTDAYLDFLTEYYIEKYPDMALTRFECTQEEHEFFQKLAATILEENAGKTAPMAFYDWMNENIGEYKGIEMGYPMDVYNYKTADCCGQAFLLCELLRCAGIPAVVASGYVGDMSNAVNENIIFNGKIGNWDYVRHDWVLYYDNGDWVSLDTAQDNVFQTREDIARWYYIEAVDWIALKTDYYAYFHYNYGSYDSPGTYRLFENGTFINDTDGMANHLITPECIFLDYRCNSSKVNEWAEQTGMVKEVIGEQGWFIEKNPYHDLRYLMYLMPNGYTMAHNTMEKGGHLYWCAQNGYCFDITGYSTNMLYGSPVFELGDVIQVKVLMTNETSNVREKYVMNPGSAESEISEEGTFIMKELGYGAISLEEKLVVGEFEGTVGSAGTLEYYVVDSTPYKSIGLKAEVIGNRVVFSWNTIENAERFVIKQFVNDAWIDRKIINENVSSAELDGLSCGENGIYAVDVFAPIGEDMMVYRFRPDDMVEVENHNLSLRGDVNGDGEVNRADRIYLARYLANWSGYMLTDQTADVNKDGEVNRADRIYLARYLANWEGYTLED